MKAESLLKEGKTEEHAEYAYETVRDWAQGVMKSAGAKVTVHGLENLPDGNMLFVSNHQSNFDIPLLLAEIPVPKGFIAKKELANVPFISSWMKQINCLFMDRDDMKQSMQIILEGIKLLKGGYSMVVFPEGTRSKGGPVAEFKAGSFKLAVKSKVPVVPVTIDGTYKLLEGNGNRIKPADVNLYIHKPIDVTTLSKDEIADLHNTVRDIIISEL
jgi:1-acyl-sn-glycerol-3-phosphate acyltransferase